MDFPTFSAFMKSYYYGTFITDVYDYVSEHMKEVHLLYDKTVFIFEDAKIQSLNDKKEEYETIYKAWWQKKTNFIFLPDEDDDKITEVIEEFPLFKQNFTDMRNELKSALEELEKIQNAIWIVKEVDGQTYVDLTEDKLDLPEKLKVKDTINRIRFEINMFYESSDLESFEYYKAIFNNVYFIFKPSELTP